jgi:hypothetical protein
MPLDDVRCSQELELPDSLYSLSEIFSEGGEKEVADLKSKRPRRRAQVGRLCARKTRLTEQDLSQVDALWVAAGAIKDPVEQRRERNRVAALRARVLRRERIRVDGERLEDMQATHILLTERIRNLFTANAQAQEQLFAECLRLQHHLQTPHGDHGDSTHVASVGLEESLTRLGEDLEVLQETRERLRAAVEGSAVEGSADEGHVDVGQWLA